MFLYAKCCAVTSNSNARNLEGLCALVCCTIQQKIDIELFKIQILDISSGHLVLHGNKITTLSSGYFVSLYYRVFFLRIVCIAAKEAAISAMNKIFVLLESDVSGVFGSSGGVGGLYVLVTSNPSFALPVISVL